MVLAILLGLLVIFNGAFAFQMSRDMYKHRAEIFREPGNNIAMSIYSFFLFLLSALGISDYAISEAVYPKTHWVPTKKLPGTLSVQCTIPAAIMALAFVKSVKLDILTLIIPIICQALGSYIFPRFAVRLPVKTIKRIMAIGLLLAGFFIVAGKVGWVPAGGAATGLHGWKLLVLALLTFLAGCLNTIGIGSYSIVMVTVYMLGMNPIASYPIMMGASGFSVPLGSSQFVKMGAYSRKISLFTSIFGSLGVLVAVFFVKNLNISVLQWIVVVVVVYSAVTMWIDSMRPEEE